MKLVKNVSAAARELGVEFDIIEYMKNPPDHESLERIITILGDPVTDPVRKDSQFQKLGARHGRHAEPQPVS